MLKHRKSRGDGADARRQQCRTPNRWVWIRITISALLLIWRTILWLLTWWNH
jgi:hypothetical protein